MNVNVLHHRTIVSSPRSHAVVGSAMGQPARAITPSRDTAGLQSAQPRPSRQSSSWSSHSRPIRTGSATVSRSHQSQKTQRPVQRPKAPRLPAARGGRRWIVFGLDRIHSAQRRGLYYDTILGSDCKLCIWLCEAFKQHKGFTYNSRAAYTNPNHLRWEAWERSNLPNDADAYVRHWATFTITSPVSSGRLHN